MESFKTANMKGSAISIPDGNSTGNYEFGLDDSQTQTYTLPESAGTVDYHINTYSCSGISLGGEYEKYDCTVTVNDIAHAVATKGYVWDANTNDLKKDGSEYVRLTSGVGTVRNLDNKQSAIIAGATYMGATSGIEGNSLDNQAAAYFKDVKVDILKGNSVLYNQYLSGATYLDNDSFQKTTTIKVSKTLSGYMVQCFVEYQDKPSFNPIIKAYTNGIASDTYKPDGNTEKELYIRRNTRYFLQSICYMHLQYVMVYIVIMIISELRHQDLMMMKKQRSTYLKQLLQLIRNMRRLFAIHLA